MENCVSREMEELTKREKSTEEIVMKNCVTQCTDVDDGVFQCGAKAAIVVSE